MSIFDKFDAQVDMEKINQQKKEAAENSFDEVPAGKYIARIEKMELGLTKKDNRPMFKVQMRLSEGCGEAEEKFLAKYKKKKPCAFMNRVIFGTKNDGNMIANVEGWLKSLDLDGNFLFNGYSEFADVILDAAEQAENLEFEIEYDASKFNSITVKNTYDA